MATKAMSKKDQNVAREMIASGAAGAGGETLRAMLCGLFGHPPVTRQCFGQVTCARCGAIVGDKLAGSYNDAQDAVIGHDCETCRGVIAGLTPEQRIGTPLK